MGEKVIRKFSQDSATYSGRMAIEENDYEDEITIMLYDEKTNLIGEITVQWVLSDAQVIPKMTVFNDAWKALSKCYDLIGLLSQHDNEKTSPEQFRKYLIDLGFEES